MEAKKNLMINCDLCDTRHMNEEDYADFEHIMINGDCLVVNSRSKSILNRLPMMCNIDTTLELEDDVELVDIDGDYELYAASAISQNTALRINGQLEIRPGTEEVLKHVVSINVNGHIKYPEEVAPLLNRLRINGSTTCIPTGCIEVKPQFTIDRFFPIRAKESSKYFAARKVLLLDPQVDIAALIAKNIRFVTPVFLTTEQLAATALGMFDENTELELIPENMAYVEGDAVLGEALLQKYGPSLYIDGSLTFNAESTAVIGRIEKLRVNGKITLTKKQLEQVKKLDASYKDTCIVKGMCIENKAMLTIDQGLIDSAPDGITIRNCAKVTFKSDVSAETIMEKLDIENCALVSCSPGQSSAIQLIGKNVAHIMDGSDDKEGTGNKILEMIDQAAKAKIVNTDHYHM